MTSSVLNSFEFVRDIVVDIAVKYGWHTSHSDINCSIISFGFRFKKSLDSTGPQIYVTIYSNVISLRFLASDGLYFDGDLEIDLATPDSLKELEKIFNEFS